MDIPFTGAPRPAPGSHPATRRLLAGLLGALVLVGAALLPAGSASAVAPATSSRMASYPAMAPSQYEQRVQYWVNRQRTGHDLRKLRLAGCTDDAAERWSGYLARNDLFHHQSMQELLDRCDAMYAGETLGRGAITPRRLVRMWMDSDGHRQVLLSSKSRRIGVGATPDSSGRWVVAANFMRF